MTDTELFALLDETTQDDHLNHCYDTIKRLRVHLPEARHAAINAAFDKAWGNDDPATAFGELRALIDMMHSELDAQS